LEGYHIGFLTVDITRISGINFNLFTDGWTKGIHFRPDCGQMIPFNMREAKQFKSRAALPVHGYMKAMFNQLIGSHFQG